MDYINISKTNTLVVGGKKYWHFPRLIWSYYLYIYNFVFKEFNYYLNFIIKKKKKKKKKKSKPIFTVIRKKGNNLSALL